ncbi:unnamed protein product [Closterium sp. NIES-53]
MMTCSTTGSATSRCVRVFPPLSPSFPPSLSPSLFLSPPSFPLPPPHHLAPLPRASAPGGPLWEGGAAGGGGVECGRAERAAAAHCLALCRGWRLGVSGDPAHAFSLKRRGFAVYCAGCSNPGAGGFVGGAAVGEAEQQVAGVTAAAAAGTDCATPDPAHAFSLKRRGFAVYCAGCSKPGAGGGVDGASVGEAGQQGAGVAAGADGAGGADTAGAGGAAGANSTAAIAAAAADGIALGNKTAVENDSAAAAGGGGATAVAAVDTRRAALDYGSVPYKEFILARTKAVGEILKAGYNVLLADADAIWLSDPFTSLKAQGIDVLAQLEEKGNPCGGFLLLVHTRKLIVLWDLLTAMFEQHIDWLKTHPSKRDPDEYRRFLRSQQHNHEQKFLNDLLRQKRYAVQLQGLDPLLFINGRDYWDRRKAQKEGVTPVMIHNNYIISKWNKTRRFLIKGMWRRRRGGGSKQKNQTGPVPVTHSSFTAAAAAGAGAGGAGAGGKAGGAGAAAGRAAKLVGSLLRSVVGSGRKDGETKGDDQKRGAAKGARLKEGEAAQGVEGEAKAVGKEGQTGKKIELQQQQKLTGTGTGSGTGIGRGRGGTTTRGSKSNDADAAAAADAAADAAAAAALSAAGKSAQGREQLKTAQGKESKAKATIGKGIESGPNRGKGMRAAAAEAGKGGRETAAVGGRGAAKGARGKGGVVRPGQVKGIESKVIQKGRQRLQQVAKRGGKGVQRVKR